MKEKAIRKYNHVDVLTPMVYALNLSGCRLLVFAYIQGFCRDEASVCYSSFTRMSETIGYARRTVAESIAALISDGYIYKVGSQTIDGKRVSGYRTYFYELMDRYDAGEDISPTFLKTRRSPQKPSGAQSAPVHIFPDSGAQSSIPAVHKAADCGAHSAIDNTMIILKENLFDSARARAEEREFIKRFVGYYQSKGWQDNAGRKYDTPEKRAGLAYGWDCKGGERLPKGENTDKFYKFLGILYKYATERGGIEPGQLLDARTSYKVDGSRFFWACSKPVQDWFVGIDADLRNGIVKTALGAYDVYFTPVGAL